MKPYETGLCFIAAIVGALVGIFCGGYLGDKTADFFTKRNGGIREPEMRLPAMMFSLISTPVSLILYGVGIQYQLHWMCPTVGIALLNFSVVQGTNVALVYCIDAYRPIAGEVTLTTMAFKCKLHPFGPKFGRLSTADDNLVQLRSDFSSLSTPIHGSKKRDIKMRSVLWQASLPLYYSSGSRCTSGVRKSVMPLGIGRP